MITEFEGKHAVVTGAASGIGLALAEAFVALGMRVVLADVNADALAGQVARLTAGGAEVIGAPTDVTDPAAVDALADRAETAFGPVHLLVNNAGIVRSGSMWELPLEEWHRVIDTNLWGVVHGIRSFVPRMIAAGVNGHIVNTGSMASVVPHPGIGPYVASKHAVLGVSDGLRAELTNAGVPIGVTIVMPGLVATGMTGMGEPPSTVADAVVRAVRNDEPYVFPQPDRIPQVAERFERILTSPRT